MIEKRRSTIVTSGFTVVELMITVVVVGILSGLAIANFSERWGQERLLASARTLHAWLDEQRRIAMQQGGPCRLVINTSTATLDPSENSLTLPDGSTVPNVCATSKTLHLKETIQNGNTILLKKHESNSDASAIIFSFRGFSQVADIANNWSPESELELRISMPGIQRERCIKLISPLGLIRNGYASNTSTDCTYNTTY